MSGAHTQVVIVGAGPCGLLAALLLARAGASCVIFDKKAGVGRHPRALGVSRRSAEIYRQLGLLDALSAGLPALDGWDLQITARSLAGEIFGRAPLAARQSEHTPCAPLHCPQPKLEDVLLAALLREPRAEIRYGCEIAALENTADGVRATLAGGEVLEAEWGIAADGAGSPVRHALGLAAEGPGDLGHFLNVMFRADFGAPLKNRRAILHQTVSEDYFEVFVNVDDAGTWLMHHFLQPGETAADFPTARLAEIVRQASGLPQTPVDILGVSPWVMSPKLAARFRAGRILLVGDAAARLSPAGGLGLNTGVQGVHNLCWKLARVLRGAAPDALLDTYETERRHAAQRTMENTQGNAMEVFALVQAALRGRWDEVRTLAAHSRRGGAGLGQEFGLDYRAGAFLPDGTGRAPTSDPVNDFTPSAHPGARAPHLWVERRGGTLSLLDLFPADAFTLLAARAAAPPFPAADDLVVFRNGTDFSSTDFESLYGLEATGAVLVRPDGYVAARWRDAATLSGETPARVRALFWR